MTPSVKHCTATSIFSCFCSDVGLYVSNTVLSNSTPNKLQVFCNKRGKEMFAKVKTQVSVALFFSCCSKRRYLSSRDQTPDVTVWMD